MNPVYWTPQARARLKDIQDYIIEQHAPEAARNVVSRLLLRTRQLETAPFSGRELSDYPYDDLRELLERPYRIIYRVTNSQIEILTVMHYRQLLPAIVDKLHTIYKDA